MTRILVRFLLGATLALSMASCQGGETPESGSSGEGSMAIVITSPVFKDGQDIPSRHTCDAEDVSPPLEWGGVPEGTRSLALICDDPDAPAGTWVHWVLYDMSPDTFELPEGMDTTRTVLSAAHQGTNDFKRIGYGGPCPPPGKAHRYFFKLYALDIVPDIGAGATKQQLLDAMEGHVLAQGELMGRYARKR